MPGRSLPVVIFSYHQSSELSNFEQLRAWLHFMKTLKSTKKKIEKTVKNFTNAAILISTGSLVPDCFPRHMCKNPAMISLMHAGKLGRRDSRHERHTTWHGYDDITNSSKLEFQDTVDMTIYIGMWTCFRAHLSTHNNNIKLFYEKLKEVENNQNKLLIV